MRFTTPGAGGFVYFVSAVNDTRLVKIGRTSGEVGSRLASLQSASPVFLQVEAAIPAMNRDDLALAEVSLHELFSEERQHGEWFSRSERLHLAIRATQGTYGELWLGVPRNVRRAIEEIERRKEAVKDWNEQVEAWIKRHRKVLDPFQTSDALARFRRHDQSDELPAGFAPFPLLSLSAVEAVCELRSLVAEAVLA